MNTFYCKDEECEAHLNQIEFKWPVVRTSYKPEGPIYKFENGDQIMCPVCKKPLVQKKEFKGFATYKGSFDSRSPAEKREILKKREKEHEKRDKTFIEYKKYMDNDCI